MLRYHNHIAAYKPTLFSIKSSQIITSRITGMTLSTKFDLPFNAMRQHIYKSKNLISRLANYTYTLLIYSSHNER